MRPGDPAQPPARRYSTTGPSPWTKTAGPVTTKRGRLLSAPDDLPTTVKSATLDRFNRDKDPATIEGQLARLAVSVQASGWGWSSSGLA